MVYWSALDGVCIPVAIYFYFCYMLSACTLFSQEVNPEKAAKAIRFFSLIIRCSGVRLITVFLVRVKIIFQETAAARGSGVCGGLLC